jgi:hypothetical protein
MTQADIEGLRKLMDSVRPEPPPVYSGPKPDFLFDEKLLNGMPSCPKEVPPHSLMVDSRPIDIHRPAHAAGLISTTAWVLDYIGVPNSLSFIR